MRTTAVTIHRPLKHSEEKRRQFSHTATHDVLWSGFALTTHRDVTLSRRSLCETGDAVAGFISLILTINNVSSQSPMSQLFPVPQVGHYVTWSILCRNSGGKNTHLHIPSLQSPSSEIKGCLGPTDALLGSEFHHREWRTLLWRVQKEHLSDCSLKEISGVQTSL